jgi:photosystem II stability/assembly factor-like uncharacterized protein
LLCRALSFTRQFALPAALAIIAPAHAADLAHRTLLLDVALAGNAVVVVGERGSILRSVDHARTWSEESSHANATLTAVSFANAQLGWAVGHDGLILATQDGGATWSRQWQAENLADSFLDVLALDATHVIAVGAYDLFVTTKNGGKTWERRKILAEDYHLNRITRGPTGTLYVAGEHGTLLRSADQGATWNPIPTPYDGSFYGILPLGTDSLLAYGLRGRVFRSDNNGQNWSLVSTNETALLATGVKVPRQHVIVLAGQARGLLVRSDDQQNFTHRDVGVTTGIAELVELPDGNLLAVGEAGVSLIPSARLAPAAPAKESP